MIAVIGSNMMDLVTYTERMPLPGETLAAQEFKIGHGGKGANQAVAAANMGSKVIMVSKVGDDGFADQTIRNFENYGIDTRYVQKVANVSSGVAPIMVDPSSQNSILIIKGANDHLLPKDVDEAAEDLKQCSMILLQLEIPLETIYYVIQFGKENGIPVLLNPAPATKELAIERVCDCAYFAPNETELSILTDMPVDSVEEALAAARTLTDRGLENIVVTLGKKGSLWVTKETSEFIPALVVQAVDTTGAGDSFIGAFAALYEELGDVKQALEGATVYAAMGVQGKGTQTSYPKRDAYEAYVKEVKNA